VSNMSNSFRRGRERAHVESESERKEEKEREGRGREGEGGRVTCELGCISSCVRADTSSWISWIAHCDAIARGDVNEHLVAL
jgi:hypothetical protein